MLELSIKASVPCPRFRWRAFTATSNCIAPPTRCPPASVFYAPLRLLACCCLRLAVASACVTALWAVPRAAGAPRGARSHRSTLETAFSAAPPVAPSLKRPFAKRRSRHCRRLRAGRKLGGHRIAPAARSSMKGKPPGTPALSPQGRFDSVATAQLGTLRAAEPFDASVLIGQRLIRPP